MVFRFIIRNYANGQFLQKNGQFGTAPNQFDADDTTNPPTFQLNNGQIATVTRDATTRRLVITSNGQTMGDHLELIRKTDRCSENTSVTSCVANGCEFIAFDKCVGNLDDEKYARKHALKKGNRLMIGAGSSCVAMFFVAFFLWDWFADRLVKYNKANKQIQKAGFAAFTRPKGPYIVAAYCLGLIAIFITLVFAYMEHKRNNDKTSTQKDKLGQDMRVPRPEIQATIIISAILILVAIFGASVLYEFTIPLVALVIAIFTIFLGVMTTKETPVKTSKTNAFANAPDFSFL